VFSSLFVHNNASLVSTGDVIRWPTMAATLKAIASDALGFYNADEQLAQDVVMDVRDSGLCIS
jgi:gamma-glutamyltranspeptidase